MRKRIIAIVLVVIICFTMLGMLTSCSTGPCEECGEVGRLNTVTFLGERFELCNACRDVYRDLFG